MREFQAMTPSSNRSSLNCDVVIVGGGISGLTLACGLLSSGVPPPIDTSAGLQNLNIWILTLATLYDICGLNLFRDLQN